MALTRAGKRVLERMRKDQVIEQLMLRDPTADQGNTPWDGQSPRDLTEARNGVSLGHEGASLMATDAEIEEMARRASHGW